MTITNPGAYILCTAPRSGSTMLCRMLTETGVAGVPGSHFHVPSLQGWLEAYGLRRDDFGSELAASRAVVEAARIKGKGATEVFGLRLQGASLGFFLE